MKKKFNKFIWWIFSYKGFGLMWYGFGVYSGFNKDSIGAIICFMLGAITWGKGWLEGLEVRINKLENENKELKRRFDIIWEDYMCKK